jgi:hypothetical protein
MGRDRLGRNNGGPIVDGYDSYDEYPSRNDFSDPSTREFICELFSHPLVTNWQDAMDELTSVTGLERKKSRRMLEKAVDLFGIDVEGRFEEGEPYQESRLGVILDGKPADPIISVENPLLVAEMYRLGLGVGEIIDVLADEVDTVTKEIVSDSLKRCGLIEGEVNEPVDRSRSMSYEEYDLRLGGTSVELDDGDEIKRRAKEANGVTVR